MKKRVFLSIIFLFTGIIIYFLFQINYLSKSNIFLTIIRNFFPDICWTLSFYFMSISIIKSISKNDLIFSSLFVMSIGLIYEMLQFFRIVSGTFDIIDVVVYAFSIMFACLIELLIRRIENEKS